MKRGRPPYPPEVRQRAVRMVLEDLGLSAARRGKAFKVTTRSDDRQHRPADPV